MRFQSRTFINQSYQFRSLMLFSHLPPMPLPLSTGFCGPWARSSRLSMNDGAFWLHHLAAKYGSKDFIFKHPIVTSIDLLRHPFDFYVLCDVLWCASRRLSKEVGEHSIEICCWSIGKPISLPFFFVWPHPPGLAQDLNTQDPKVPLPAGDTCLALPWRCGVGCFQIPVWVKINYPNY